MLHTRVLYSIQCKILFMWPILAWPAPYRFCLSETSCPQEDHFPPNLCVKVNGKPCSLPVSVPARHSLQPACYTPQPAVTGIILLISDYCHIHADHVMTECLNTVMCSAIQLLFCGMSHCSLLSLPGISSSNQKRCRAKATEPAHQHYLTGQVVDDCAQHHCGIVDL